mmetsp:Transcript_2816/g.9394  ORF Transcript_2816/g.9394 Transcript_2816/m.9394 type:complete len:272 (-) Transcript_2816:408-1223(-)
MQLQGALDVLLKRRRKARGDTASRRDRPGRPLRSGVPGLPCHLRRRELGEVRLLLLHLPPRLARFLAPPDHAALSLYVAGVQLGHLLGLIFARERCEPGDLSDVHEYLAQVRERVGRDAGRVERKLNTHDRVLDGGFAPIPSLDSPASSPVRSHKVAEESQTIEDNLSSELQHPEKCAPVTPDGRAGPRVSCLAGHEKRCPNGNNPVRNTRRRGQKTHHARDRSLDLFRRKPLGGGGQRSDAVPLRKREMDPRLPSNHVKDGQHRDRVRKT